MIGAILNGIIKLILGLVALLLAPIDMLIASLLPDVSSAMGAVSSLFIYIGNSLGWALSFVAIPTELLSLVVLYYIFKLTVPLLVSTVKLALKWYDTLKP